MKKNYITRALAVSAAMLGCLISTAAAPAFTKQEIANVGAPREGSGIAWGDYNNDGYQDAIIFGAWSGTSTPRLFKNNGNETFTDVTEEVFGKSKLFSPDDSDKELYKGSIAWLDYNSDGYLDVIISGDVGGVGNVTKVYKNKGANAGYALEEDESISLAPMQGGGADAPTRYIDVADYNNDGYPDILMTGLANYWDWDWDNNSQWEWLQHSNRSAFFLYKNTGGGFERQDNVLDGGKFPRMKNGAVAWGDFNKDGYPDILFSGEVNGSRKSGVYKNNGDGTFGLIALKTADNAHDITVEKGGIAWIDYDNDGYLDIVITGQGERDKENNDWGWDWWTSYLLHNNGDETFTEILDHGIGKTCESSIAVGDLNGDGFADIALIGQSEANAIFYNNAGNGTFTKVDNAGFKITDYDSNGNQGGIALVDFNGDGAVDISAVGNYTNPAVWKSDGAAVAPPAVPTSLTQTVTSNGKDTAIVTLRWSSPDVTLRYNIYAAKAGSIYAVAPVDTLTGKLKVGFDRAALLTDTGYTFASIKGGDYTWSVQAVNSAGVASAFAAPQEFSITRLADTVLISGSSSVAQGLTTQLEAVVLPEDAGNKTLTWSVEPLDANGGSAQVSADGLVTGLLEGDVKVTAATADGSGAYGTYTLHVNGNPVTAITISGAGTVFVDSAITLTVATTPGYAAEYVAWLLADGSDGTLALSPEAGDSVAARGASRGLVKVVAQATDGSGMADTLEVDVIQRVSAIDISGVGAIYEGDSALLTAAALPANANNRQLAWEIVSGSDKISLSAAAGDSVWVKSLAVGEASIKVSAADGGGASATRSLSVVVQRSSFAKVDLPSDFPQVWNGGAAWADYDNDGYLDVLVFGSRDKDNNAPITKLYRNNASQGFSDVTTSVLGVTLENGDGENQFPVLKYGSATWIDYDNDGNVDLFVTGNGVIARLYRNRGDGFNPRFIKMDGGDSEQPGTVPVYGAPSWQFIGVNSEDGSGPVRYVAAADYNNDGLTDIVTNGWCYDDIDHQNEQGVADWGWGRRLYLYKNNGYNAEKGIHSFSLVKDALNGGHFDGISRGSLSWADFDNDGDMDLLFCGDRDKGLGFDAGIYRNNGDGTFTKQGFTSAEGNPITLKGSEIAWLDYDNDGYLDVYLTGEGNKYDENDGQVKSAYDNAYLLHNNGNGTFTEVKNHGLNPTVQGSIATGDLDGDGYADVLVSGQWWSKNSGFYFNNGSATFTNDNPADFPGDAVTGGLNNAVDFDNDGKLDVMVSGKVSNDPFEAKSVLLRNTGNAAAAPAVPTGFSAALNSDSTGVELSWSVAGGAPLRYNVYAQKSGGAPIAVAPVDVTTGRLRVGLDNVALLTAATYTLAGLESGEYTFGVQAINNARVASAFATAALTVVKKENSSSAGGDDPTTAVDKAALGSVAAYKKGAALAVTTDITDKAELAVYSIVGAKVWSKTGVLTGTTEINGLPQGAVYLVVVRVGSKAEVRKVTL
ncbi:MAG: FG-GAP-like repeat-containing protein [Prevotellaceae bacterium]|nr:FG-GAP-like repeat-containing protein [Prevotellaceae bacterium]